MSAFAKHLFMGGVGTEVSPWISFDGSNIGADTVIYASAIAQTVPHQIAANDSGESLLIFRGITSDDIGGILINHGTSGTTISVEHSNDALYSFGVDWIMRTISAVQIAQDKWLVSAVATDNPVQRLRAFVLSYNGTSFSTGTDYAPADSSLRGDRTWVLKWGTYYALVSISNRITDQVEISILSVSGTTITVEYTEQFTWADVDHADFGACEIDDTHIALFGTESATDTASLRIYSRTSNTDIALVASATSTYTTTNVQSNAHSTISPSHVAYDPDIQVFLTCAAIQYSAPTAGYRIHAQAYEWNGSTTLTAEGLDTRDSTDVTLGGFDVVLVESGIFFTASTRAGSETEVPLVTYTVTPDAALTNKHPTPVYDLPTVSSTQPKLFALDSERVLAVTRSILDLDIYATIIVP